MPPRHVPASPALREERSRVRTILRRLARAYPEGHPARPVPERRDPLDELILTLLSQNTSDVNRDRAWTSMRARYPAWEDVLGARAAALERAIRPGGLAHTKAPRILSILREVLRREGGLSLERLRSLSDAEVRLYLTTLPGVGAKTAACVLAFSLDRPVIPVDTHVARIAARLGLVGARAPAARIQSELEALVPPAARVEAHLALIAHGRMICRAQRPDCPRCPLLDICPTGSSFADGTPAGP